MIYFVMFWVIFIADRVTKQWALCCAQEPYVINDLLSFELMLNRGVSWSMFHSESSLIFGVVTLAVIGIAALLSYYAYTRYRAGISIAGELLILAGALSNIVDRVMYHGVIDFIVCTYNSWTFPVFNIADVAIIGGVIYMLWTHARTL